MGTVRFPGGVNVERTQVLWASANGDVDIYNYVKMPSKMMEVSAMVACDCYCGLSFWNQRAIELTEIAGKQRCWYCGVPLNVS